MDIVRRAHARVKRGSLKQSRTRKGVKYADPLHAGRHPFQTYMLTLGFVSSVPLILGQSQPGSITETLPRWLALAWGVMLCAGSGTALIGSYWLGNYANALTVERIGLLAVGTAAIIYASAIAFTGLPRGLLATGLVLGFGLSCLRRSRDIGLIIRSAIHMGGS